MTRIGIVGLGHWGPNLVRNFDNIQNAHVAAVCDVDVKRLGMVASRFPGVFATSKISELINKKLIDALVVASPTKTHFSIAQQALERGIHTFVEKPLATSVADCETLIELAEKNHIVLMVGHIFLHNAAVVKLKELVSEGALGNVCYISADRLNLGPVRQDVNALWDLASHDISIILNLIGQLPVSVNAQGLAYVNKKVHDVCTLDMQFNNDTMATIRVSWLDPNKTRRMTVVGDRKMAVYDDIDPREKIKIYDKGITAQRYADTFAEFQISYRYGDTYCPWINEVEPLRAECEHFIDCIQQAKRPITDGYCALDVVRVLAAADVSLLEDGRRVHMSSLNGNGVLHQRRLAS